MDGGYIRQDASSLTSLLPYDRISWKNNVQERMNIWQHDFEENFYWSNLICWFERIESESEMREVRITLFQQIYNHVKRFHILLWYTNIDSVGGKVLLTLVQSNHIPTLQKDNKQATIQSEIHHYTNHAKIHWDE